MTTYGPARQYGILQTHRLLRGQGVVRIGRVSRRVRARTALVCGALITALAVLGVVSLGSGTLALGPVEVATALVDPSAPAAHRLAVFEWRLPRYAAGVLFGLALGIGGAFFQSITRNPLGSPDVIGFSTGSYTGAVIMMLWVGSTTYLMVAAGALAGGGLTAVGVYLLAWRRGVEPFRLVIVGLGVSAMLGSVSSFLLLSVGSQEAMLAVTWAAGSLSALGYAQLGPAAMVFGVLALGAALVTPSLVTLELGDDTARGLGIRADAARGRAAVIGVALTALVTAGAGPISFVALAAPQIARRLAAGSGPQPLPAALTGAVLLVAADIAAQRVDLPVGVLTVCTGGAYLAWLLARQ